MSSTGPIRVAIVNDYEIVVAGIAALLAPYAHRINIVELDAGVSVQAEVDVILYDTFGQPQADRMVLAHLVAPGSTAKVVVYSWNIDESLLDSATRHGVAGYLGKGTAAEGLVEAIERVHRGEHVAPDTGIAERDAVGGWPGQHEQLTARESEVLALICQGLSNEEVCEQAFVGLNTLKTHIRNLYRKIGATSRSQAVVWGLQRGFEPDRVRRTLN